MSTDQVSNREQSAHSAGTDNLPAVLPPNQLAQVAAEVLGRNAALSIDNFPTDKMERWEMTAIANSSEPLKYDDLESRPIAIKWFYAHPVTIEKPGGELVDATRVVLFDAEKIPVAFVSAGIAKGLGQIINIFGMGPYNPPLVVKIARTATRNGHTYNIVPVKQ